MGQPFLSLTMPFAGTRSVFSGAAVLTRNGSYFLSLPISDVYALPLAILAYYTCAVMYVRGGDGDGPPDLRVFVSVTMWICVLI